MRLSIENNHLREIAAAGEASTLGSFVVGIAVVRTETATIAGNTLRRIGVAAPRGTGYIAGIAHLGVRRSKVSGNDILEVGTATELPGTIQAGILLHGPFSQNDVSHNHVERDAARVPPDVSVWSALLADEPDEKRPIIRVGTFATVRLNESRTLVLNGDHVFVDELVAIDATPDRAAARTSSTGVHGNVLLGRGIAPVVAVSSASSIQFGGNRCEFSGRAAVVTLTSAAAVVHSNIVRGGASSIAIAANRKSVTVLGNGTSIPITINNQPLTGTPWEPLNVQI